MKRRESLIFSILLAAAVVLATIHFSGQPGETSQGLSRGIVERLLAYVYPDYSERTANLLNYFLRRGAHLILYFLLGFSLTNAFQWQKRVSPTAAAIILGILFAATDEFHQLFSQGRSAEVHDVMLDACGIIIGSIVSFLWWKRRERHKKDKQETKFNSEIT